MQNRLDLTGKVALVTGGGRGIGREIVRTLADAGADIAVADMDAATAADAAAEVQSMGRQAISIQADVRNSAQVDAMAKQAFDHFGKIDILVANAGVARNTPAEDTTDEEWDFVVDINLNGVFRTCRAVGKIMLQQGYGSIVNIASMSGSIVNKPQPQAHYNASKAAVIMLTKSLAAEWADRNVRVNCVSPGYIGTEMTKKGMSNEVWKEFWLEMTPMKRVGQPQEVANAVLFLASDAATFATGTDLIVDGGYSSW
jgi:NAD(P)-dependent dehydrogenase (short-subunit alcohol dehydrogenase family)